MKKIIFIISIFLFSGMNFLFSQSASDVSVYLLTCGPGTETYSIYGHCALRIAIPERNIDQVYNWGVFDFSTKHFAWKFAKGKLDYMLDDESFERFLSIYSYEQRWVQSQKINLETEEKNILLGLVSENLKPENVKYRYDFLYDNCATRIRDLLEKSLGKKLTYPEEKKKGVSTFREKVGEYERPFPWLKMGIDLLLGTPTDKKVTFREKMFLPLDLQNGLSEILINRNGKMVPLLQNPATLIDFESPVVKTSFLTSPIIVFTFILILLTVFFGITKNRKAIRIADITIFSMFSLLALLMIFFNFFTDHEQLRKNLNMIWLSPFVLLCLTAIIANKEWIIWFRIVFVLCLLAFILYLILPSALNNGFLPVIVILLMRSSARADFSWNPLSITSI